MTSSVSGAWADVELPSSKGEPKWWIRSADRRRPFDTRNLPPKTGDRQHILRFPGGDKSYVSGGVPGAHGVCVGEALRRAMRPSGVIPAEINQLVWYAINGAASRAGSGIKPSQPACGVELRPPTQVENVRAPKCRSCASVPAMGRAPAPVRRPGPGRRSGCPGPSKLDPPAGRRFRDPRRLACTQNARVLTEVAGLRIRAG